MNSDLVELGWTDDQWNLICSTVTEEAQKARVAAQVLPLAGPEDPTTEAIPNYTLGSFQVNPTLGSPPGPKFLDPINRLSVDSDPNLYITRIGINVQLRSTEVADPALKAALVSFRRAATYLARIEDSLVFNGRLPGGLLLGTGAAMIPPIFTLRGNGVVPGILWPTPTKLFVSVPPKPPGLGRGQDIVESVTDAVNQLDAAGQIGPYACVLGNDLFAEVLEPSIAFVMPRDRILPILGGPLVRSSTVPAKWGAVIALSGNPVELVVASDISVRFLQATQEPRYIFRVSERVALRIREDNAIAVLREVEDRKPSRTIAETLLDAVNGLRADMRPPGNQGGTR